jgi:streptogramin lyase
MARRALILATVLLGGCPGDDPDLTQPRIECSAQSGVACTWAGLDGEFGFDGDGLHRQNTLLYWTMDMKFASDGTVWFIDWNNHLLRRVDANGIVSTVVGWTDPVFPGDGSRPASAERTPEGISGTEVQLNHPTDLAELPDGTILMMAWHNHKLRAIDPATGNVRIVYGGGAGFAGDGTAATGASVLFRQPKALEVDADGNIFIGDQQNFRVRRIDPAGNVTTVAGNGMAAPTGGTGDGDLAINCTLGFEAGSNPEPSGGLARSGNLLFIADTLGNRVRVVDLDSGMINAFAGTGTEGYSGDGGAALEAELAHPRDLEIGPDGDLYIADTDNSVIRAVDLDTGDIRTVAGTGELGMGTEQNLPALETMLARPFGIEFDADGALYIADTINSRILRVAP